MNSVVKSLALLAFRRHELERWIDEAIALLDDMDGDPDREDDGPDCNGDEGDFSVGQIAGGCGL